MGFSQKKILIISPTPWDVSFPARQHYARELAKKGAEVFYLNPPSKADSKIEMSENLWIVDYKTRGGFLGLFNLSDTKLAEKINSIIGVSFDILWSFDNSRFLDLTIFKAAFNIYHSEEWHKNNQNDIIAANSADLVLCLSKPIMERLKNLKTKKIIFDNGLGNAFVDAIQRSDEIKRNTQFATGRIRCGYLGNLQNKYLDVSSFEIIIRENPKVEFHLVGPFVKESNLAVTENKTWEDPFVEFLMSAPNVRLYGSLMTVRIAEILQTMDMFLVSYDSVRFGDIVANPQKILEYLSVGNVIVANKTNHFEDRPELVLMPNGNQTLSNLFKKTSENLLIHNSDSLKEKRIYYAKEHTYEKQLQKLDVVITEMKKLK